MRVAFETRRQKMEECERERLRRAVVETAREAEFKRMRLHQQKMAIMEEQKRMKALRGVKKVEERHTREKADIHRRFYEPSVEVLQQREHEWERRRMQRADDLLQRFKKVERIMQQKRDHEAAIREERRVSAPCRSPHAYAAREAIGG